MTDVYDLVSEVYSRDGVVRARWRSELFGNLGATLKVLEPKLTEIERQFKGCLDTPGTCIAAVLHELHVLLRHLALTGVLYQDDGLWYVNAVALRTTSAQERLPVQEQEQVHAQAADLWDVW